MKKLKEILRNIPVKETSGSLDLKIEEIHFDSREVTPGTLFVAIKGLTVDGHKFLNNAAQNGAIAILCEKMPSKTRNNVTYIVTEDTSKALGMAASRFYDSPSEQLQLIGITGTNGKTTTATLLYNLFLNNGEKTGLISTIANYINKKKITTVFTTPDAISVNKLLYEMVKEGCQYAFMEVSSHALKQNRISGLNFSGAVFTNITHEHLDYHNTFQDYIKSKKLLFDQYLDKDDFALVNSDDKNSKIMVQNTPAKTYSFALKSPAEFKGKVIEKLIDGTLLQINGKEVWIKFIGEFNASNLLGVFATASLLGYDKEKLYTDLTKLKPVDGRFETIRSKDHKTAIVDYAHSPDALENILRTIKDLQQKGQHIITVIGAGGDRDKTKRPEMAKISAKYSDKVVLTSDNPRTEKPESILSDMTKGVSKDKISSVTTITDRTEGIKTACMFARQGDIILIAGKGHETYQEVNGVRHHFDDREIIKKIFELE
ncbi:MAG: UDP-N-acetylmuramoyl-L-alanyl-D-glutamate--2,6-diaminopimelate ligase [Bacteroidales bacterium]